MIYIKQYDSKTGEHIGYKVGEINYTLSYTLPDDAEINEGDKPSVSEILKQEKLIKISKINKRSKITLKKGSHLLNSDKGIVLTTKPPQKYKTFVVASPQNSKKLVPVLKKLK